MALSPSALDRFLAHRGASLLGSQLSGHWRANLWVGGALLASGAALAVAPLLFPEAPDALTGVGGMLAGLLNLGLGWAQKRREASGKGPTTRLTPEALKLLASLMGQGPSLRATTVSRLGTHSVPAGQGAAAALADLLEEAAFQANRVLGTLASRNDAGGASDRLKLSAYAAIDEAMADALHQTALLDAFPEANALAGEKLFRRIRDLRELADRMEDLHREPTLAERLSPSSMMESVLEELRLEAEARQELQKRAP